MMVGFLNAHGYDPGPSQRPLLAGAISGILGTIPAVAILIAFGSLNVEAEILRMSAAATLGAGCVAMAMSGAAYARFFGRAANAVKGGWLFGMSFGFALWATGAVLVLPLLSGGRAPAGTAAAGLALSLIIWGIATGILVPFVHRPLHESLKTASKRTAVGPDAAAAKRGPMREQRQSTRRSID
jgi:ABC-type Co2+ transport system permease subunit